MRDPRLSCLLHASSKVGKTTLATSLPTPLLVADADYGWEYVDERGYNTGVSARVCRWNPMEGPPPQHDDTWDICVVDIKNWGTIEQIWTWLESGQHNFLSFCLDSITELQSMCKKSVSPNGMRTYHDWGSLLEKMDEYIKKFRNLTREEYQSLRFFCCIAETVMKDGKWRPSMQGQISVKLPYWFDLVGYLYADYEDDENAQPTVRVNRLLIGPDQAGQIEAGSRVHHILGMVITQPDLSQMINDIYKHLNQGQPSTTKPELS